MESADVSIISGLHFFIIHKLIAVYERHQESEEITVTQLEELPGCFINKGQVNILVMEEPKNTASV